MASDKQFLCQWSMGQQKKIDICRRKYSGSIPAAVLFRSFHPCCCCLPPLLLIHPPLKPPVILSPRFLPGRRAEIHLRQALLGLLGYAFWAPTNVVRYIAEWFCGRSLCRLFCGRSLRQWLRLNGFRWLFCGRPLRWQLRLNGFRYCLRPFTLHVNNASYLFDFGMWLCNGDVVIR